MRKVIYLENREALKKRYRDVFSNVLPDLETSWADYKKKYKSLQSFNVKVEDLLTMEYEGLVKWYNKFVTQVSKSDRKKLCKSEGDSLLTQCFNYTMYYDRIKAFFLDSDNGFDLHVCHYCETAYINNYEIDEDEDLLYRLNNASAYEVFGWVKKSSKYKLAKLLWNRPFKDVDSLFNVLPRDSFYSNFLNSLKEGKIATFDLDHVLDKGSCPLVALSLFNFVPSCHVCNSRVKHSGVLGRDNNPEVKLSPTSLNYNFDNEVKIKLQSRNGNIFIDPTKHQEEYEIDFKTYDEGYRYEISFFKLKERYAYHISEALRILELKQKYNDSALAMLSDAMGNKDAFSAEQIREDILGIGFHKENGRCFEKMYRDINKDNDPRLYFME